MDRNDRIPDLHNPVTGMRYRVLHAPANPARDLLELEATYPPHSPEPPDHYHPVQAEQFEVLGGEVTVRADGQVRTYPAGASFEIPPGTRHAMWNAQPSAATVRWRTTPALGTLAFHTKLCQLAAAGQTGPSGRPRLLQATVIAVAYRRELRLTSPPPLVQAILFVLLAPLGRLLGYRAR